MASERKAVRPRRGFAVVDGDGYLWLNTVREYARDARDAWCEGSTLSWAEWKKERRGLRVIRVEVRDA